MGLNVRQEGEDSAVSQVKRASIVGKRQKEEEVARGVRRPSARCSDA
jgi:hypothetical protein